jgi:hypothetical protein
MKLINRDIINKGLQVTSLKMHQPMNAISREIYSYDEVILKIDIIKEFLITKYDVTPGEKIVLATFYWPDYISWIFACAELGLSFVIIDYPKTKEALKKFEVYGKLDYLIYDIHYPPAFDDSDTKLINANHINDFTYSNKSTPNWGNEDSILIYAASSGSTGTPNVATYKQKYFWDLIDRNANLYNLNESDKCFHSKILHHGSVSATYFFPTIKHCKYHYHAPFQIFNSGVDETSLIKTWVNMLLEDQITRAMFFYDQLDHVVKHLDLSKKTHNNMTAYVISKIKPDHINKIVKEFGYKIVSIFGTTQTSGPLFLPEININNCDKIDASNMGFIPDDFYKFRINRDSLLEIKTPWHDDYICSGDKFEVINDQWIYKGRENIYKINGRTVYTNLLIDIIESTLNLKNEKDFDIVVDQEFDKIFLRSTYPVDLEKLNNDILNYINEKEYKISLNLVIDRDECFSGIKFDPEYIRIICRSKL